MTSIATQLVSSPNATIRISESSRYKDTPLSIISGTRRREWALWVSDPAIRKTQDFQVHIVRDSDIGRLDALSTLYYGTPSYWWFIADANDLIDTFSGMSVGQVLRIPGRKVIEAFIRRGSRA